MRWRTEIAGLVVAAALAAWVPAAWAGPAWLAPVSLSAPRADAFQPDVAMNPAGDVAAVWLRADIVQAVVRPAGGSFSERVDLTPAGEYARTAQVAIDQAGDAMAVWQVGEGQNSIVQAAVRAAGGSFSAPVNLSAAAQGASAPQVAMNQAGDAIAVWERYDGANSTMQAAVRPAGGSFSAPVNLAEAGESASAPQVAIDQAGDAVVVWRGYDATRTHFMVRGAVRPAGGSFSAPVNLSAANQDAMRPQVAMDQAGDAVAVWERYDTPNSIVQAAVRAAGGSFSAPVDLSAAGQAANEPQVAIDQAGDAMVVWRDYDGTNYIVRAAVRAAGGSFSAPVDLSAAGLGAGGPQVAMDQAGDAVAVWQRYDGTNTFVQAAGYDATSPQLRGLTVPPTGVAGSPVSFSVSPFDVWSALADTSWVFGDGASTVGTAPTHTYTGPGTFTVGVSAADTLANSVSATRTITISPAPRTAGSDARRPPAAVVTRLRLRPSAFRVTRSGPSVKAAAARTGTQVSYALNVPAGVRFAVQRAARGRRVGARCLKPSRANRKRKPCTRFTPVPGSFTRTRPAGADRFTFTGRLRGRALRRGRYRLLATPTANARSGRTTRASFRIIR